MALNSKIGKNPMITFGVLTDVQYADCDDRPAPHDCSKTRFYRRALKQVDAAFKFWESHNVKFILQLGDIIDGLSQCYGGSYSSLRRTLEHFEQHDSIPTFHSVGNHELYNFNRKELAQLFYESVRKHHIPSKIFCPLQPVKDNTTPVLYYKFSPIPNLKCISLDCFDVSVLGYDVDHPNYQAAAKILMSKHGHNIFDDWDSDGELKGLDVRFQQMNGAIGEEQMSWLDNELKDSDEQGQKVIVFGHVGLYPDSTDWSCLMWNYNEVIQVFHQHKCVLAYFCGHTHESGYAVDSHGISYIVFAGIVETPPDSSAFATVSLYEDQFKVTGHGLEQSYIIPFQNSQLSESENPVEIELETSPAAVKVEV